MRHGSGQTEQLSVVQVVHLDDCYWNPCLTARLASPSVFQGMPAPLASI